MNYRIIRLAIPLVREDQRRNSRKIKSANDVLTVCSDMADLAVETLHLLTLDNGNHVLGRHMLSLGGSNNAPVDIRGVYRTALLDDACSAIVVHSHPAGSPDASREDVEITRRLVQAGEVIGTRLLDHCIVFRNRETGDISVNSLRETCPEAFG